MAPTKEADAELYAGIDLHSNNCVVLVLDEQDRVRYAKRLPDDWAAVNAELRSCGGTVRAVAVESTFNWYWLVDGLQDAGFEVKLVNTAAVKQYVGLKHGGDFSDARHLAHLLRLGILPTGYIYPRAERAVRDLLRKRSQLVRQRSRQILSIENFIARNLRQHAGGSQIKRRDAENIDAMALLEEQELAVKANLAVMRCLDERSACSNRARWPQPASGLSWPNSPQRRRRKPWARMPHSRNASNSSLMNRGSSAPELASVWAMKLAACCCTRRYSVLCSGR